MCPKSVRHPHRLSAASPHTCKLTQPMSSTRHGWLDPRCWYSLVMPRLKWAIQCSSRSLAWHRMRRHHDCTSIAGEKPAPRTRVLRAVRQLCAPWRYARGGWARRSAASLPSRRGSGSIRVIPLAITSLGERGGPAQEGPAGGGGPHSLTDASYHVGEQSMIFLWQVTRICILLICAGPLMAREVRRARDWRGC